jgi:branched-chain amino acid transport system substrate-binding protein
MRSPMDYHRGSKGWRLGAAALTPALLLAGATCGAGAAVSGHAAKAHTPTGSPIVIDVFSPFSGANAFIGTTFNLPPVKIGVTLINEAGGINGHPAQLITTDSGSDPVDAVPAIQRLFVQHSDISVLLGLDTSNATALAPVMESHKVVTLSLAGPPQLDHSTYKYLYRLAAPDSLGGSALAQAALHFGNKRIALMFDSTGTSQSDAVSTLTELKTHGGKVVLDQTLPVDQPSYRTEVEQLLASKAQLLITETDPQTAATLFANMKQLDALGITVVGGGENESSAYYSSVAKSVGGMAAEAKFMYQETLSPASAPGQAFFNKEYAKYDPKAGAPVPPQYSLFDGLNIAALAMDEAHSSSPAVYVNYIRKVTDNPGGVVVTNYAQGYSALKAGKKIQYEGASGQLIFNRWNWPPSGYKLDKLQPNGTLTGIFTQTAASIAKFFK